MNLLITGGSGFIGTHLINYLSQMESISKIIVVDTIPNKIKSDKIIFYNSDIKEGIDFNFKDKIDTCIHLAALAKEPAYAWEEYFKTNYFGTKNVIEFCTRNNIKSIVFTSTMMVFKASEERFSENELTTPDTAYGISKIMAELLLKEWAASSADNTLKIVRPGVVFGKWENGNYTRLYRALKKNLFFYTGKSSTVKSSIYVKDLVRFLHYLSTCKTETDIFNLVYPYELTIKEICDTFLKVFKWKRYIPTIPFKLALLFSYPFELLESLGIKTGIHHRRIEKLYYSTNISSELAFKNGFELKYSLQEALEDWKKDCYPKEIF